MNINRMTALIVGLAVVLVLTLGFAFSRSIADTTTGTPSAPSAPVSGTHVSNHRLV